MGGLGATRRDGGDTREEFLEAEQLLVDTLRNVEAQFPPGHPWIGVSVKQLVELYGPEKLDDSSKRAEYEARLPERSVSAQKE